MDKTRPRGYTQLRGLEFLYNDYPGAFPGFSHFKRKIFSFQTQSNNKRQRRVESLYLKK
nr:MAG TPA: hypothetical protein [Caudoviricetes sp.]